MNVDASTSALKGRVVVVTGAGGGIGSATAEAFVRAGATVVGLDLTSRSDLEGVSWLHCDVSDDASVARAFVAIAAEHGKVDTVVNNAAIGSKGSVETADEDQWRNVFDINVFGVARVSRRALPLLRKSDAASIVNVGSVNAVIGTPLRAVYSASKGAVAALTRAMAADLMDQGIRVNAIHPGPVLTGATGRFDADRESAIDQMRASQPLGRLIDVEEIAAAIVYLANPVNRSLTGAALVYDGSHSEVVNVGTV